MKSQGKDTTEKVRRMKELKKLSLKEELDREAEIIEEEVGKRHDLDDLTVSEEAETALFNKIQDYEYDNRIMNMISGSKRPYTAAGRNAGSSWRSLLCSSSYAGV